MEFPEPIDFEVFHPAGMNGQLSTEANVLVGRAFALLQNGRHVSDGLDLRRAVRVVGLYLRSLRYQVPVFFPVAGSFWGVLDRGFYRGGIKGFCLVVLARLARWFMRVNGFERRPGWNDFLMAHWCVTGSSSSLTEMYHRAIVRCECCGVDYSGLPDETLATARWMVISYRSQAPDYDRELKQIETLHSQIAEALDLE